MMHASLCGQVLVEVPVLPSSAESDHCLMLLVLTAMTLGDRMPCWVGLSILLSMVLVDQPNCTHVL
jgi:hypothetical protein